MRTRARARVLSVLSVHTWCVAKRGLLDRHRSHVHVLRRRKKPASSTLANQLIPVVGCVLLPNEACLLALLLGPERERDAGRGRGHVRDHG